jgi:hypothetical protein
MKNKLFDNLLNLYVIIWIGTFIYLTFFDFPLTDYNWWNWMVILPLNAFQSFFWPIYWIFFH